MTITRKQAVQFLLRHQGLDAPSFGMGLEGVVRYLKRVGCIQYDPLDVVGRNADLVLQARIPDYRRSMLESVLYEERSVLDGWDKMASLHLTEDWPFFGRIRACRGEEIRALLHRRNSEAALELRQAVLEALEAEGPMLSTRLKLGGAGNVTWGHRNLSGAAMDWLYAVGDIGIRTKRGAQRVYDHIDRLLPEALRAAPDPFPDEHTFRKWYVTRRIGSVGLLWNRNGGGWLGYFLSDRKQREAVLNELTEEGMLQRVEIEGIAGGFWLRAQDAGALNAAADEAHTQGASQPVRFLAPLDNLLWDRALVQTLFEFAYSWEVYLPEAKRAYGYYVLPVLQGDRFIARCEPAPQRGTAPLMLRKWWWEPGVERSPERLEAVRFGVERLAESLGTTAGPMPESVEKGC